MQSFPAFSTANFLSSNLQKTLEEWLVSNISRNKHLYDCDFSGSEIKIEPLGYQFGISISGIISWMEPRRFCAAVFIKIMIDDEGNILSSHLSLDEDYIERKLNIIQKEFNTPCPFLYRLMAED